MIEKMKNGKWENAIVTPEAFDRKVDEISEVIDRFGFNDRKVCMYSTWETVDKLLEGWKDYEQCTFSSKKVLISEVNGFIKIMNAWIEYEQEPKVNVRFENGNIKAVAESTAKDYVKCGLADFIQGKDV